MNTKSIDMTVNSVTGTYRQYPTVVVEFTKKNGDKRTMVTTSRGLPLDKPVFTDTTCVVIEVTPERRDYRSYDITDVISMRAYVEQPKELFL